MFRLFRCVVCVNKSINVCGTIGKFSTGKSCHIVERHYTSVVNYYAGKSVFITGATGFLGKVLIERLLYNCKDIDNIFVLIRPKRGESTAKRLQSIFNAPVFNKLKEKRSDDIEKVVAFEGDLTSPQLGINTAERQRLINQVSVVFHLAATVRFADPFHRMIDVNLEGTDRVMSLSKEMKKLDTFVYVSTIYSNPDQIEIDEKVYPPPKSLEEVRRFTKEHGTDERKVKEFLDGFPNTYAFSKAMCEDLVSKNNGDMPTIIIRPSAVTSMINEPLKGWVDNWVATTALFSDVARGLSPVLYGTNDNICDIIPVDYVTNLTTLAAARGNRNKDVLVYNICTSSANPLTWKEGCDLFLEESRKHGYSKNKERMVLITKSAIVVFTLTFLLKTIPFLFADLSLLLRGKKPWHMKEHGRAIWLRNLSKPHTSTSWVVKCDRTIALVESLNDEDKNTFPCDPRNIVWTQYFSIFCKAVKEHLLKDKCTG